MWEIINNKLSITIINKNVIIHKELEYILWLYGKVYLHKLYAIEVTRKILCVYFLLFINESENAYFFKIQTPGLNLRVEPTSVYATWDAIFTILRTPNICTKRHQYFIISTKPIATKIETHCTPCSTSDQGFPSQSQSYGKTKRFERTTTATATTIKSTFKK